MKVTREMVEQLKARIEELALEEKYGYIGIRVQEQPFQLGTLNHRSVVWDDGDETDEQLNGVCVTNINAYDKYGSAMYRTQYYGDHLAIVCGDDADYGEDLGELIISDPTVVDIIA